jgi:hypothetical protein
MKLTWFEPAYRRRIFRTMPCRVPEDSEMLLALIIVAAAARLRNRFSLGLATAMARRFSFSASSKMRCAVSASPIREDI